MEQGQEERNKYENPKKRIGGVFFDTEDPTTRLIGESSTKGGWVDHRGREIIRYDQYWRTKDGHYFLYSGVSDPKHIDTKTAHDYMGADADFKLLITKEEKREIDQDDERRQEERY